MKTHIIINNIVIDTIVASVEETKLLFPEAQCIEAISGGVGWRLEGSELFNPDFEAVVVPQSITPRQGYIILSRYGLLTPVKDYFTSLEGQEGEEARIELEFAQEWKRSWPTLINAAHAFGLTDAQIDQMFIAGSKI